MSDMRPWVAVAALLGLLATGLGAYGAHGLAASGVTAEQLAAFDSAVQYHFFHALALLALGLSPLRGGAVTLAASLFVLGVLGFSGSIYAMVLLGTKGIGLLTPAGGLCFMLGWATLIRVGCRLGGKNE